MPGLVKWLILVFTLVQLILGMLANGFIGLVNGSSWFRKGRISLSDFIITNLVLARISLLWTLLADIFTTVYPSKVLDEAVVMKIFAGLWTFLNHLNIWLFTCLSVFYCLKVASFSHPAFLWLKWRVSRLMACMLLGTLLLACASSTSLVREFKIYSAFSGMNGTGNMTEHAREASSYKLTHLLGTVWDVPPLILSLASYFLLLLSLWRHTGRMQRNGASSQDPSTEAHRRVITIVFSFLLLFLLYYLAFLITYSRFFLPGTEMVKMIGEGFAMFCPSVHSFAIITGNRKLKETFVQLFCCECGCLKPESNGPIFP